MPASRKRGWVPVLSEPSYAPPRRTSRPDPFIPLSVTTLTRWEASLLILFSVTTDAGMGSDRRKLVHLTSHPTLCNSPTPCVPCIYYCILIRVWVCIMHADSLLVHDVIARSEYNTPFLTRCPLGFGSVWTYPKSQSIILCLQAPALPDLWFKQYCARGHLCQLRYDVLVILQYSWPVVHQLFFSALVY